MSVPIGEWVDREQKGKKMERCVAWLENICRMWTDKKEIDGEMRGPARKYL